MHSDGGPELEPHPGTGLMVGPGGVGLIFHSDSLDSDTYPPLLTLDADGSCVLVAGIGSKTSTHQR